MSQPTESKVMIVVIVAALLCSCGPITTAVTETPKSQQDFTVDLMNTITEMDIVRYHETNLYATYVSNNEELQALVEAFVEFQGILADPDPDLDRLHRLTDEISSKAGLERIGEEWEVVDQERYDRFLEFYTLERIHTTTNSLFAATHLLLGVPYMLPTYDLNRELLGQILDDIDDEYLMEIEEITEKGQSEPDQVTADDLLTLTGLLAQLLDALNRQVGLEPAAATVERIEGTDQLRVTIEGEKVGLLQQHPFFQLDEDGVSEQESGGMRFVLLRTGGEVHAWKIVDEGRYAQLGAFQDMAAQ